MPRDRDWVVNSATWRGEDDHIEILSPPLGTPELLVLPLTQPSTVVFNAHEVFQPNDSMVSERVRGQIQTWLVDIPPASYNKDLLTFGIAVVPATPNGTPAPPQLAGAGSLRIPEVANWSWLWLKTLTLGGPGSFWADVRQQAASYEHDFEVDVQARRRLEPPEILALFVERTYYDGNAGMGARLGLTFSLRTLLSKRQD